MAILLHPLPDNVLVLLGQSEKQAGLMRKTTPFDFLFRTSEGRQRFIYWQTLPLRRLTFLLLAIFCLFGMIGFVVDLFSLGQKPLLSVILWTVFTGVMGIFYLLVLTRKPRYILVPVALHVLGSRAVASLSHALRGLMVHPTMESGVRTGAVAVLVLSAAACVFFMLFIQGEGRHSVRIQTELALAHGIQKTLVPIIEKQFPRFEVYGVSAPSEEVGGDIVDVVPLHDGSVFAYIADISGHGLSAGIFMGMVKTSIRTQLLDSVSPISIFDRLNEVLPQVKESHMYATCTAMRIIENPEESGITVEYAIASQPAFLRYSSATGSVDMLSDQQLPIGLLPGIGGYQSHRIDLSPDDLLLIVTDGIVEPENKAGEAFGFAPLERIVLASPNAPLKAIVETVREELRESFLQSDDQTFLLVRSLRHSDNPQSC